MFSVIIPTYNRLELLKRAIDSVLNQTFGEFEIIVVDDCSSDDTWEWLNSQQNKKVSFYKNDTNKGLSYNRNFAVSKSKGEFIALLDDDDFWYENHLEELNKLTEAYPDSALFCNSYIIDYGDKLVEPIHDNKYLENGVSNFSNFKCFKNTNALCAPSTICIKRNVFLDLKGFNEDTTVLEDVEFYARIGILYPIVSNRKITVVYSQNTGDHLSLNHVHKKKLPDLSVFKKEEEKSPFLKEWLDSIRFQIGLKFLEASDKRCMNYFNNIAPSNLSLSKRLFVKLNYSIMNSIVKIIR